MAKAQVHALLSLAARQFLLIAPMCSVVHRCASFRCASFEGRYAQKVAQFVSSCLLWAVLYLASCACRPRLGWSAGSCFTQCRFDTAVVGKRSRILVPNQIGGLSSGRLCVAFCICICILHSAFSAIFVGLFCFWRDACLHKVLVPGCTCTKIHVLLRVAPAIFRPCPSQFALSHTGLHRSSLPPTIPFLHFYLYSVHLTSYSACISCVIRRIGCSMFPILTFASAVCQIWYTIHSTTGNAKVTLGSTLGGLPSSRDCPAPPSCLPFL